MKLLLSIAIIALVGCKEKEPTRYDTMDYNAYPSSTLENDTATATQKKGDSLIYRMYAAIDSSNRKATFKRGSVNKPGYSITIDTPICEPNASPDSIIKWHMDRVLYWMKVKQGKEHKPNEWEGRYPIKIDTIWLFSG